MAGEPSSRKVKLALKATLTVPDGPTWHIDRPADEPFGNAELPAGNIRVVRVEFEPLDQGTTIHRATIDLDLATSVTATESIDAQQEEMAADAVAILYADRTLGGLTQNITPQDMTGTEDDGAEAGIAILRFEIIWLTPHGDHRTIIGASGLIP